MAGGSAAALADVTRGMEPQQRLGPCLATGMGGEAMVERLNSWGAARDRELIALRADLLAAQAGVSGAFGQAERALIGMATDWRLESEAMRVGAQREAEMAVSRLELVVGDARARFAAVDATHSADLAELGRRLGIIDGWAQAEPQRVTALLRAAVPTSPGGTPQMFYPSARASPPGTQQPQTQQPPTAAEVPTGAGPAGVAHVPGPGPDVGHGQAGRAAGVRAAAAADAAPAAARLDANTKQLRRRRPVGQLLRGARARRRPVGP
jgi:hypothetical protein